MIRPFHDSGQMFFLLGASEMTRHFFNMPCGQDRWTGCGRAGRFTLVELLVAITLSLIIGGVALTAFTQTAGVGSLANARIEALNNARAVVTILERDLRSAYLEPDGTVFAGTPDDVELLTLSGQGGVFGPARVVYDLGAAGDGTYTLFRTAGPARGAAPAIDDDDVVAFNIVSFSLRYYYGGAFYSEWDSGDSARESWRRLPAVVEISVETVDDDGKLEGSGESLRRLVDLEAGAAR